MEIEINTALIMKIGRRLLETILLLIFVGFAYQLIVGSLSSFDMASRWPSSMKGSLWALQGDHVTVYNHSKGPRTFVLDVKPANTHRWLGYSGVCNGSLFIDNISDRLCVLTLDYARGIAKINSLRDTRPYYGEWALYKERLFHIDKVGREVKLIRRSLVDSNVEDVTKLPDLPTASNNWVRSLAVHDRFIAFDIGDWICVFDIKSKSFCRTLPGSLPVFSSDGTLFYISLDSHYYCLKICKTNVADGEIEQKVIWQARGINRFPLIFAMIPQNRPGDILGIFVIPNTDMILCEIQKYGYGDSYIAAANRIIHLLPISVDKYMWVWAPEVY